MINLISGLTKKTNYSFSFFIFVLFIIAISDAVMSYVTPVFLDKHIPNEVLVGIVFSASSAVGFIFDIYAGAYLKDKNHKFFLIWTSIMALSFPLILLFGPKKIIFFLLAMGIWGIYYEARSFCEFNYVKYFIPKQSYSLAWGVLVNLTALAYLIGPIIATNLLLKSDELPLYFSTLLFLIGLIFTLLFIYYLNNSKKDNHKSFEKEDIKAELKIWKVLSGRLWIVWIMWFLLWVVDAAFWSVGIILAEKLKDVSIYGLYLIPLYMIPKTFMGFTVGKLSKNSGKKYLAFVSSLIGGIALIFMGYGKNIYSILTFVAIGSAAFSLSVTALSATFEEYIERLGKFGPELIGLEQTASSLGYIISPIISFSIASILNEQLVFSTFGIVVVLWAGISLILVPRKIKMPQTKLKGL